MNVGIVDYGAGNLSSVRNALTAIGVNPILVRQPRDFAGISRLVLPGVGSFGDCMFQLEQRELSQPLRQWITVGKPFLGICLGYQILFDSSAESPGVAGLGIFRGSVKRFALKAGLKVPHMGWNSVEPTEPESDLWVGLGALPYYYFVHSYFPVPQDTKLIAGLTSYGEESFASMIQHHDLVGCQFHPEKSQTAGLGLIRNFLRL